MPAPAKSVLVVEDDPDLMSLMAEIVESAGYRVASASDGVEALEQVARGMPDIILLDMRMPRMNGWEFAREFRSRHGHACPIVVVTAAENARQRAEEIGAEGWLAKPFDLDDVIGMLQQKLKA